MDQVLQRDSTAAAAIEALRELLGPRGWIEQHIDQEPYLTEPRGLFPGRASLIVRPADRDQVAAVVRICHNAGLPMIPLGGRTGLVGGGTSQEGHPPVVISLERLNRILDIDPAGMTMTVEAGCVLEVIHQAAAEQGLLFPINLGARGSCMIGGNISTNAGGIQVLRYGTTREMVLGLEVVLPDGEVWKGLSAVRKDNTGYDLKQLFIGAEGTLGIVTAAVLRLFPATPETQTALVAVPDVASAIRLYALAQRESGGLLSAFELIQRFGIEVSVRHAGGVDPLSDSYPWYVLLEMSAGGSKGSAELQARMEALLEVALEDGMILDGTIAVSQAQAQALWHLREALSDHQHYEGESIKHDVAVPISSVAHFVEDAVKAATQVVPGARCLAFGHIGDGNIHFNLSQPLDMGTDEFLARTKDVYRAVHDVVFSMGGSISAEHGIGQLKRDDLARYKTPAGMRLLKAIKQAIDPSNLMNPGKIISSS
ncbi:FAD-binding oxidoreductase [Pararoseomonas sp. SCSIO 73927]|uniref:FAD-binding oxidoreductase n=1 Tax=Pararoseomonas sp. SCSIO 73927 TaxID=3114537 RepID=UPI0030CBB605